MTAMLASLGLKGRRPPQERAIAFVVRWAIVSAGVWAAAALVEGIRWEGWLSILVVALILSLLNVVLRPVLFWLTLPMTIVTLGLFLVVMNACLLWLADRIARTIGPVDFTVDSFFWDAILGAAIISAVTWVVE